jgi:FkbM family methyltransferase
VQTLGRVRHSISTLTKWLRTVGALSTFQWLFVRIGRELSLRWPASWRVHPRQAHHALTARLRRSSDLNVFSQIFIEQEYLPLRNLKDVSLVLDLGANVGYSSAYFLSCFPNSRVVAVEPDERNVEICKANLKPYGDRVLLLHGAVWSECTDLCLSKGIFGDGREWATQVVLPCDVSAGNVKAWDVGSLIEKAGGAVVDLLKVDIEQAELVVFGESAKAWLPRVRNICIELHGPDCQQTFFNALADFNFELEHSGELTICKNLRLKDAPR